MPTHFSSPIFADTPLIPHDATLLTILRTTHALIFGKTHTTQFAATTTGGPCANPLNLGHTPGGSSSGSAAAVAAGHVPLALGTQTGGSVVRPASFCGVWGFKPTWGTVGTEGVGRYSVSCDTVGWFSREVGDLGVLAGEVLE
jgi:Asp-tRNA(Asn)/Glu-tRNA(Gln) amidotransferase A subunit family amidase